MLYYTMKIENLTFEFHGVFFCFETPQGSGNPAYRRIPADGLPEGGDLRYLGGMAKVLVADDEPDLLMLMRDALEHEGYSVSTARDGEEALEVLRKDLPDIIVMDLWMPRKDGFQVCKELKSDPGLRHLPIIILSAAGQAENKIQGLDLGADDFVTKPVDLRELLARIRMVLRRTSEGLDANPLTRLPGSVIIENRISATAASGELFAVLYLDLNEFKAYNDAYGYDAGNQVLKETANLLVGIVRELGLGKDFLGHIGGDDFILLTHPDRMEDYCRRVIKDFDALAPSFYKPEDRAKGRIISKDRQGRTAEFPLLSMSIGVCHNKLRPITSYGEVSLVGSELKKHAKTLPGSSYSIDRRLKKAPLT